MTSKSELIRPATDKSCEDVGCDDLRGQVMAAEDDDDMEWLDVEKIQYPHSDEEDAAEYEFQELEMGFDLRLSERAGVAVDGEAVPHIILSHEREPEESHVQCHSRRHSASSTTWKGIPITIQGVRSA